MALQFNFQMVHLWRCVTSNPRKSIEIDLNTFNICIYTSKLVAFATFSLIPHRTLHSTQSAIRNHRFKVLLLRLLIGRKVFAEFKISQRQHFIIFHFLVWNSRHTQTHTHTSESLHSTVYMATFLIFPKFRHYTIHQKKLFKNRAAQLF